jgi:hypothetical protein
MHNRLETLFERRQPLPFLFSPMRVSPTDSDTKSSGPYSCRLFPAGSAGSNVWRMFSHSLACTAQFFCASSASIPSGWPVSPAGDAAHRALAANGGARALASRGRRNTAAAAGLFRASGRSTTGDETSHPEVGVTSTERAHHATSTGEPTTMASVRG